MTDWRAFVATRRVRTCGACRHARLAAWTEGRDEIPLPILRCRRLPGPAFPNNKPCAAFVRVETPTQPQP